MADSARPALSVCIICKNEAKQIEQCLASVSFADDIVIVDSGSDDGTLEIARRYTDNIHHYDDWPGFGPQRQRAQTHARHDWIMAIDCDEVVSPALQNEILTTLAQIDETTVLQLNRLTNFCGHNIRHSGWYPDIIDRIYNRKHYRYNERTVHEALACKGATRITLQHDLLHNQCGDLYRYINKRNRYAAIGAQEKAARGKRASLSRAVGASFVAFVRHYFFKRGFLDGRIGFVIAVIQMQYTFNKYLFLAYKN